MGEYIGTFGCGIDDPFRNHYVRINAATHADAQAYMYKYFGKHWSRVYDSEIDAGVYEFNLKEYTFIDGTPPINVIEGVF